VQPGFDRARSCAQRGRDLGHRQLAEVMQDQHGAIVDRKPGEGSVEDLGVGDSSSSVRSGRPGS